MPFPNVLEVSCGDYTPCKQETGGLLLTLWEYKKENTFKHYNDLMIDYIFNKNICII